MFDQWRINSYAGTFVELSREDHTSIDQLHFLKPQFLVNLAPIVCNHLLL
jgi:hypothetical protein